MFTFKLILFAIFTVNINPLEAAISDKRLCANADCTEPISLAKTLLRYGGSEEGMLSFPANVEIKIFSKSAGTNMQIWGAEYNGKRGYVPVTHVKETKVFTKEIPHLVDTEIIQQVPSNSVTTPIEISPNKPKVIVDGTTIYDHEDINSSSVYKEPVLSTLVPEGSIESKDVPKPIEGYKYDHDTIIPLENIDTSASTEFVANEGDKTESIVNTIKIDEANASKTDSDEAIDFNSSKEEVDSKSKSDVFVIESEETSQNEEETLQTGASIDLEPQIDPIESRNIEESKPLVESELSISENVIEDTNNIKSHDSHDVVEETQITNVEKPSTPFNVLTSMQENVKDEKSESVENISNEDESPPLNDQNKNLEPEIDNKQNENSTASNNNTPESPSVMNSLLNNYLTHHEPIPTENSTSEITRRKENADEETTGNLQSNSEISSEKELITNVETSEIPQDQEVLMNNNDHEYKEQKIESEINNSILSNFGHNDNVQSEKDLTLDSETNSVFEENEVNTSNAIIEEAVNTVLNTENEDITEQSIPDELVQIPEENSSGIFEGILSYFGLGATENENDLGLVNEKMYINDHNDVSASSDSSICQDPSAKHCLVEDKVKEMDIGESHSDQTIFDYFDYIGNHDSLIVLIISGITVVLFLWGYMVIDKMRKEAPLIAKINNLEKLLLVSTKENQLLSDKISDIQSDTHDQVDAGSAAIVLELKAEIEEANTTRSLLEEQIQALEKELENSTEVGLELNRMLSEVLSSQNGTDTVMSNIEQLQKQLVEQQTTINTVNARLNEKDTENHELQLELEINNKKVMDLQQELDKMVSNILKNEEEKEQVQTKFETEIASLKNTYKNHQAAASVELNKLITELNELKKTYNESQRCLEIKSNEYNLLKDSVSDSKNDVEAFKSLLDINSLRAEIQQLRRDNNSLKDRIHQDQQVIGNLEGQLSTMTQDIIGFKQKYEEADKEKLEALTKLDVLNSYFKEKEAELQKELNKHQSMWLEKQGEATSTTERIKFMQEEVQSFKAQNASLKQEIVSQEVELKSQISVLEKKAHENWVTARQAERKLEDAKQEAAQLRNRLTLRERSLIEEKVHNRIQSPLESNGELPLSPMHMNVDTPSSPPLLYGHSRDHLTTSPPLGLPPFLPPPPGVPFMPPPMPGMPPFMPPPPSMFPGDHRPPPLGRMSSPPINRYSPDSRLYSPYDRNSPSPTDDEDYRAPHRGYSPYNGRDNREYARPAPTRLNIRNNKGTTISSGSGQSNESLEKLNKPSSKV